MELVHMYPSENNVTSKSEHWIATPHYYASTEYLGCVDVSPYS